jgi:enoyl-CoA hydratase/carnithine racemase
MSERDKFVPTLGAPACEHLYLQRTGEIARLIIDRPEKRNALSLAMWRAIPPLIDEVVADVSVKVLIIQGVDETAFAAGADIDEIAAHSASAEAAWTFMDAVHAAESAIGRCGKPVIAMIRGDCIGGGVEIALACDIRFAQSGCRFGITPAKLGLVYSLASTVRLVQLVGPGLARDFLYSGRLFDSADARSAHLIDREFPAEEIIAATQAYAKTLCRRSQWSIRAAKAIVHAAVRGAKEEDGEIRSLREGAFLGPDLHEGIRAFQESRPANFTWS